MIDTYHFPSAEHMEQTQGTPKKKKKNLAYYAGYYMSLNQHTIQGRLTLGFLFMGGLSVALVVITHCQWRGSVPQTQYALTVAAASRFYSTKFESACKGLVINGLSGTQVGSESADALYQHASASRDTLLRLSKAWKSDRERALLAQADGHFAKLHSILQQQGDSAARVAIIPVLQSFLASIDELVEVQSKEVKVALDEIASVEQRLNWLIPLYISFVFTVAYFIGSFMIVGVLSHVKQLKKYLRELGNGNLPETMPENKSEMNALVREVNSLIDNLGKIKDFALYVGKGDFEKNIKVFDEKGDLGTSLAQMRDELRKVSVEEKKRFWANEGLSHFAGILHGNHNLDDLCHKITVQLVKYMHANQSGLFVVENEETGQPHLSLKSCYAYDRKKYLQRQIQPGQGLVGQAWQEGQTIYLRQIPGDYIRIKSGLGDAAPRYLLIVPLKISGNIEGMIELASFRDFEPHEILFVEGIAENIASTLASAKTAERTQRLLDQSRTMAEQMSAQEEEMRQSMEELMATQEEMGRSQRATAQKEAALDALLNNTNQASVTIDPQYRVVALNNALKNTYAKFGVSVDVGVQVLDVFEKHFGGKVAAKRKAQYDRAFGGETFMDYEENALATKTMHTEIYHQPIRNGQGEITGVAISAKDVSEQRRKEQQMEQALLDMRLDNERLAQSVEELAARLADSRNQPQAE